MKDLFRNLVKLCRFSRTEPDTAQFPVQQVEYMGKAVDTIVALPYGWHANIPEDMLGILLQISTQEQNRVVLPISPKERPKPIESGEVVIYHPIKGQKILLKNDGTFEITGDATFINDLTVNGNVRIDGTLIVDGAATFNSIVTFEDDVQINANLTVTGNTTLGNTVTSGGKDISNTHLHSGIVIGGSNSGPPV